MKVVLYDCRCIQLHIKAWDVLFIFGFPISLFSTCASRLKYTLTTSYATSQVLSALSGFVPSTKHLWELIAPRASPSRTRLTYVMPFFFIYIYSYVQSHLCSSSITLALPCGSKPFPWLRCIPGKQVSKAKLPHLSHCYILKPWLQPFFSFGEKIQLCYTADF